MAKFRGRTVNNQPAAQWKAIYRQCAKHEQFVVTVEPYDPKDSISDQQRKYWHAMPVKLYAQHTGNSELRAEIYLKRECGEHYFVLEATEKNLQKRGKLMFDCSKCKGLSFVPVQLPDGIYACPECHSDKIKPVFVLSKMELSIQDFNVVLDNAYEFLNAINCRCQRPDPNWKEAK